MGHQALPGDGRRDRLTQEVPPREVDDAASRRLELADKGRRVRDPLGRQVVELQLEAVRRPLREGRPRVQEPANAEDPVGQDLVVTLDVRMGIEQVHEEAAPGPAGGEDHEPE